MNTSMTLYCIQTLPFVVDNACYLRSCPWHTTPYSTDTRHVTIEKNQLLASNQRAKILARILSSKMFYVCLLMIGRYSLTYY